ncbi:MAG: hypothetical protein PHH21_01575 [Candidatus Pacebacteria bacterium]|nr:hypothetical protein [Candidatus Paceibacterota bacterium]
MTGSGSTNFEKIEEVISSLAPKLNHLGENLNAFCFIDDDIIVIVRQSNGGPRTEISDSKFLYIINNFFPFEGKLNNSSPLDFLENEATKLLNDVAFLQEISKGKIEMEKETLSLVRNATERRIISHLKRLQKITKSTHLQEKRGDKKIKL